MGSSKGYARHVFCYLRLFFFGYLRLSFSYLRRVLRGFLAPPTILVAQSVICLFCGSLRLF